MFYLHHYWEGEWEGTTHGSTSIIWTFFHHRCWIRSFSLHFIRFSILPPFFPFLIPPSLSLLLPDCCTVSQARLVLMNVAKGRKGLERCRVWAEDCPIHHTPHHRVDPLNRLLGFLGSGFAGGIPSVFDLSFLSIVSADWESIFKTR